MIRRSRLASELSPDLNTDATTQFTPEGWQVHMLCYDKIKHLDAKVVPALAPAWLWLSQSRRRQGFLAGILTTSVDVVATRFPTVSGVVILVSGSAHQGRSLLQASTETPESKPDGQS